MSLYPAFVQASTLSCPRSCILKDFLVSTIDLLSFEGFESTPMSLDRAVLVQDRSKQPARSLPTAANKCIPSVW